jgi:hypothetical protein
LDFYLSRDGGTTYDVIGTFTTMGSVSGYYDWTVTGPASNQCRIRIIAHDDACNQADDVSNNNFTISSGILLVTSPNGGEHWQAQSQHDITWQSSYYEGNIGISYTQDGSNWEEVVNSTPNDGSYTWTLPPVSDTLPHCRVKIFDPSDGIPYDISDADFTITPGPLYPPANFTATLISLDNQVLLHWDDTNGGTAKTRIYRGCPCGYQSGCSHCTCKIGGGTYWSLFATIDEGTTEYLDSSLKIGSGYYTYRVTALRGSQESSPSNEPVMRIHPNPPTNVYVENWYCNRPCFPAKITPTRSEISTFKSLYKPDCYPPFPDSIPSDASAIYADYPVNQACGTFAGMDVWSKSCQWYNHNVVSRETTVVNPDPFVIIHTPPDTIYCTGDWTYYFRVRTIDIYGDTSVFVPITWGWPYACCVGPCHVPIGPTGGISKLEIPSAFYLGQNYPNPFNPATVIEFEISQPTKVSLKIYNILGQLVRVLVDEEKPVGIYQAIWDGKDTERKDVASGIYFYRLQAGEFNEVKRMALMK